MSSYATNNSTTKYIPVADFYVGKSVFITGGTGFLGKVYIEKLLYSCPGIENVYVLIRRKKNYHPEQRIQQLLCNSLFQRLKNERPEDLRKIIPIEGNITAPNLGICQRDEETLTDKVSVVYHTAATVKFTEELKVAISINLEGTKKIIDLCKRMKNLQAFVHLSTAFCNPDQKVVEEIIYPPPKELTEVYEFLEQECKNHRDEERFISCHPNTYTFTKALAETYILRNHGDLPTVIVRPSVVVSYKEEPLQGWLDSFNGLIPVLVGVGKGVHRILCGQKSDIQGMIPVDYVTNLAIVAATRCKRSDSVKVYNSCTSSTNPINWGDFSKYCLKGCKSFGGFYPSVMFIRSKFLMKILLYIIQVIPAYVFDIWRYINGKKPRYVKLQFRLMLVMDITKYFTSRSWFFEVKKAHELWTTLSPEDQKLFPYNPRNIIWKSFIKDYCEGINKHLLMPYNNKEL